MKNKKILITGATGFIGSHLTELFVKKGYKVVAFDRYNTNNNWGWLENSEYKNEVEVILGDIRDYDSVAKAIKGCDVVFHLAALIGIPYSYVSPLAYIKTNVEGTYNVLEASKNFKLKEVIITSTSETYGTAKYIPIDEKHRLIGQSPYSASKISADQLAISYHRSFDLPVKIVKPFNTFGPRQSQRAIIPSIILQMIHEKKLSLGNLWPTRDFLYVTDTCNAFLEIMKCKKLIGDVVNIGNGKEISVMKLVEKVSKILEKKYIIKKDSRRIRPSRSEVDRLCCDNKKLKKLTKWKPQYSLDEGLRETVDWCLEFQNKKTKIYHI